MSAAPRPSLFLSTAVAALVLTGCGAADGPSGGEGARDGLQVAAGFYPLEWAAERVGGDRVAVTSLTPPGGEAHDLELAPRDVATVSEADLVVYLAGFQPALDEAVASEAADRAWDAGAAADLSLIGEDHGHAGEDEHADEGHAGEEEHADEEHAAEEEHADEEHAAEDEHADGGAPDPHFWLDPVRLADVGDALAAELGSIDPDGADAYEQNAAALRQDLEDLDAEMQAALENCRVTTLVTSHEAFGYLGERYGFEVIGISGLTPSDEPSPGQLAEIAGLVRDRGVTTVYTETLVDPAVAETVAREAGAETAVLDPLEGLTDESAGSDYLEVMRANLAVLQAGQSCA